MLNQRITFAGASGAQLGARLSLPADGHVRACALFAHCFTCSNDLKAAVNISRAMTQQGLAVMRFDFTGLGESEGDFAGTTFSSNIEDLVAAAALTAEQRHRLLEIADRCPVYRTLSAGVRITTQLEGSATGTDV